MCVSKVGRTEQVFEAVEEIGTGEKSVGVRVGGVILSAQGVWGRSGRVCVRVGSLGAVLKGSGEGV